jgi:hypothetical protein
MDRHTLGSIFISSWLFTIPLIKHLPSWRRLLIFVILCEEFCTNVYVFLKCEVVLRPNYTILLYLSASYYLLSAMTSCKLQIVAICVPSEVFIMWPTGINLLSGSFLTNQMRCLQTAQCCVNPWWVQHKSRYSVSCRSKFITVHYCYGDI